MKLLELIPNLKCYIRIKRNEWDFIHDENYGHFLVKSEIDKYPLIKIDINQLQISKYILTYDDLIADDWEILE